MFEILSLIPGKKRTNAKGWASFNAVCCHHRGHRPDKKGRAGIHKDGNNWSYHCFNCGYKCTFTLGRTINQKTKQLLLWCGVDETQIDKWSFQSFQKRDLVEILTGTNRSYERVTFKETSLPENTEVLDASNPDHTKYIEYLSGRGIELEDYPFLVTPNDQGRNAERIVIPYTHKNKIVGYVSLYLDGKFPKYVKDQQVGYVFGYDLQKSDWAYCIVTEGTMDAISIGGCALGHNTISYEQAQILYSLNRTIIVVPDYDNSGLQICDRALELGFQVSMPNWEDGIKDINDAVKKYGKIPTLLSILQNATNSRIKVTMMRKKIAKRIHPLNNGTITL